MKIVSIAGMAPMTKDPKLEQNCIGKITPVIDSTFRLSETREAFGHMMQDEIQGRVIITAAEVLA